MYKAHSVEVHTSARLYAFCIQGKAIKFGIGRQPLKRMAFVQTGCPYPVSLIAISQGMERNLAFQMELTIHTALHEFRLMGEWFESNPRTLALAKLINNAIYDRIKEIIDGWVLNHASIRDIAHICEVRHLRKSRSPEHILYKLRNS